MEQKILAALNKISFKTSNLSEKLTFVFINLTTIENKLSTAIFNINSNLNHKNVKGWLYFYFV